jgi:hypothetical protein
VFFYCGVTDGSESGQGEIGEGPGCNLRVASHILDLYGLDKFLDDIDGRRDYWRGRDSLAKQALGWLAGIGWGEYFKDKGEPWDQYVTPEAFRQRHLIMGVNAIRSAVKSRPS